MNERRSQDVATRRILDETLLVPVRGQVALNMELFALNEVATFVWSRLDGETSPAQLVDALVAEYAVDRAVAEDDLAALLAEFRALGLLLPAP